MPAPSCRPRARWPSTKPIIVIKPGRTAGAAKAAASHTGSLTGSDEVLEIAFRRSGVLRGEQHRRAVLHGERALQAAPPQRTPPDHPDQRRRSRACWLPMPSSPDGGELAELSPETMEAFNDLLPAAWSHNNPVDILGDASPERYAKALEIAANDPNATVCW